MRTVQEAVKAAIEQAIDSAIAHVNSSDIYSGCDKFEVELRLVQSMRSEVATICGEIQPARVLYSGSHYGYASR